MCEQQCEHSRHGVSSIIAGITSLQYYCRDCREDKREKHALSPGLVICSYIEELLETWFQAHEVYLRSQTGALCVSLSFMGRIVSLRELTVNYYNGLGEG